MFSEAKSLILGLFNNHRALFVSYLIAAPDEYDISTSIYMHISAQRGM